MSPCAYDCSSTGVFNSIFSIPNRVAMVYTPINKQFQIINLVIRWSFLSNVDIFGLGFSLWLPPQICCESSFNVVTVRIYIQFSNATDNYLEISFQLS